MPVYQYTAYARDGQQQQGQEYAQNSAELERRLKQRKLILVESKEAKLPRLKRSLLARLIGQLSPLLNSGIVIDRALQIIGEDSADKTLSNFAGQLRESVKRGQQLSQALESMGAIDPLAITVIRAGEASGQLAEVMQTLEIHYDRSRKMRADIQGALLYPIVLVVLSLVSIIILGIYVIPTFKDLFQDKVNMLSWNARFIFAFSDLLMAYGWYILGTIILTVVGLQYYIRQSQFFRSWWSQIILRLPFAGSFLSKIYTAQVMSLLAVQLRNGVPLVSALELITKSTSNIVIQQRMMDIQNEVRRGRNLSLAMNNFPGIPTLAVRFLAIGEETGKLDSMAEKAGQQIGDEVTLKAKTMANLLGPLIILVMGLVIAFIVISMLVAVYSLTDLAPQ
ncbi:MAG: type II secretion system F family protein [Alphaproteobacteria bacterium]|nr:MAG: type II secretion system F family protein [Alphaproteobacteria bacterium]